MNEVDGEITAEETAATESLVNADASAQETAAGNQDAAVATTASDAPEPTPDTNSLVLSPSLTWSRVRARYKNRLKKQGRKPAGLSRSDWGIRFFIIWCTAQEPALTPENITAEHKTVFSAHVDASNLAKINRNINRRAGIDMIEEAIAMAQNQTPDEPQEEYEDEQQVEGEEEEAPPSRARRQAPPPQQVFMVQPAKAPRTKNPPGPPPRSTVGKLLKTEKVRIFKRSFGGKKIIVGDYLVDEIGGSLHKFIKDYVDVEFHEPNGMTTYEVFEVDPRNDSERGIGSQIVIQSANTEMPDDDITKARGAVDLIRELRDLDEEKRSKNGELFGAAQKQAVEKGDTANLMMLMMMQNMMQPKNETDIAAKVLEHLRAGKVHEALPMPAFTPLPPPVQYIPPPPPPEDPIRAATAKVLEHAMMPKVEKSTADFVKEMLALRELFAPPPQQSGDAEMKMLLRELISKTMQPQQSGLDAIVSQFGKIKEVVTTLAPQVNAGGLVGAFQSILTPQLGQAFGDMLAKGIQQQKPAAPPPANGAKPQQPQTPVQQTPQPGAAVATSIAMFRAAADEPGQIVAAYGLASTLYDDPAYKAKLEPALQALLAGNVGPAQVTLMELVQEIRPELAKPLFIKKVVAHLIRSAGGTPPPGLESPAASVTLPEPVVVAPAVVEAPPAPPVVTDVEPLPPKQGAQLAAEEEKPVTNGAAVAAVVNDVIPEVVAAEATIAATA